MKKGRIELNYRFIQNIQIDWDRVENYSYLRKIPALQFEDRLEFTKDITFFVGENGSGKSTLLEAIAVAYGFNPEGGSRNYDFSTYDSHSELHNAIKMSRGIRKPEWSYFLRAESFYNVATKEEDYADRTHPSQKFHEKSHGESFLALVQGNFRANGLYLLDEPEAALSPQRQLTLLIEMDRLAKQGAQFIVASHSPILLGIPGAQILSFDDGVIHECEYTDTDSYQVTEMFVNNREYLLGRLFK